MFVDTEARPVGEPAKVGTLKLSAAMRIGAALRPQGRDTLFWGGRSCALGAAYEAIYGHPGRNAGFPDLPPDAVNQNDVLGQRLERSFPVLRSVSIGGEKLQDHIWRKNDSERWSREKIADWLESQGY